MPTSSSQSENLLRYKAVYLDPVLVAMIAGLLFVFLLVFAYVAFSVTFDSVAIIFGVQELTHTPSLVPAGNTGTTTTGSGL